MQTLDKAMCGRLTGSEGAAGVPVGQPFLVPPYRQHCLLLSSRTVANALVLKQTRSIALGLTTCNSCCSDAAVAPPR
jgi:hypothetical protein